MTVYNHSNRVKLYEQMVSVFGKWDRKTWGSPDLCVPHMPVAMSSKSANAGYEEVLARILPFFNGRQPKSAQAIAMQVKWMVSTQASRDRHANDSTLKTVRQNRWAAYEAGFITMSDIIHLEETQALREKGLL